MTACPADLLDALDAESESEIEKRESQLQEIPQKVHTHTKQSLSLPITGHAFLVGNGQRSPLQWIPGPFFALSRTAVTTPSYSREGQSRHTMVLKQTYLVKIEIFFGHTDNKICRRS